MAFDETSRARFNSGMRRRLGELQAKTEESLNFAIETMMMDRIESYFRVEEGLAEIDRMVVLIQEELDGICEFTQAQRLESRLEFIEDRFEDFESEIRQRPKRRRRRINLFNFFKAAGGGGGDPTSPKGEIQSAPEAYRVLRLEFGSPMTTVTRAFRQKAKKLHPDSRNGDQSSEPELRRIIEAYQYLKADLSIPRTEAP